MTKIDDFFNNPKNFKLDGNISLEELRKICDKYTKFNHEYEEYDDLYGTGDKLILHFGGDGKIKVPFLYDALSTGCSLPFAYSTFNVYNDEIENDIRIMIKTIPEAIKYRDGKLRCRDYINPLIMACFNEVIPNNILEELVIVSDIKDFNYKNSSSFINIINDINDPSLNLKRQKIISLYREKSDQNIEELFGDVKNAAKNILE